MNPGQVRLVPWSSANGLRYDRNHALATPGSSICQADRSGVITCGRLRLRFAARLDDTWGISRQFSFDVSHQFAVMFGEPVEQGPLFLVSRPVSDGFTRVGLCTKPIQINSKITHFVQLHVGGLKSAIRQKCAKRSGGEFTKVNRANYLFETNRD